MIHQDSRIALLVHTGKICNYPRFFHAIILVVMVTSPDQFMLAMPAVHLLTDTKWQCQLRVIPVECALGISLHESLIVDVVGGRFLVPE